MKLVHFLLLTGLPGTLYAQLRPAITAGADGSVTIDGRAVEVLADSSHQITWSDVRRDAISRRFRPAPVANLNFGFSTADYWARFHLQITKPAVPRVLEVGFMHYSLIELYLTDSTGRVYSSRVGDAVDGHTHREFPFYTFGMRLLPRHNQTVYIHLVSHYGQQYFPLTIWTEPAYLKANASITLVWGGFYGILLIVFLYHAFVFAFTRERSYLLLSVYLFWLILYECCRSFNRLPYFDSAALLDWLCTRGMVSVFSVTLISFMLFYEHSLRLTHHFSWFRWAIVGLSVWCLYCVTLVYKVPIGQSSINQLVTWQGIPVGLTMIVVSTLLWVKGVRIARFYALASIATAGGAMLMMMQRAGFISSESMLVKFGFNIGTLLEFVLLTFALADRFREERKRQRAAELTRIRQEARQEIEHQLALKQERERMSVELHNDIGNSLMSARLMLNRLDAQMLSPTEQTVYAQLTTTMAETYDRLRDIAHGLNTQRFVRTGLVAELHKLINVLNTTGQVQFGLLVSRDADQLPAALQATLYSFAAELTQNVLHHAHAENTHLRVAIDDTTIRLSVRDDGTGPVADGNGQGLRSIREQAGQLGGSFSLKPLPEGGTSAVVILPLAG